MKHPTPPILTEMSANGIATILLNRPHVHHALNSQLIRELTDCLIKIKENKAIKIVILKSTGRYFCAGADLEEMRHGLSLTKEENLKEAKALAELMFHLYHLTKPTIAIVQGSAFGGGIGLIACCQLVIAAANASFCFSETKLGLIPAVISPYIINAIGLRQARFYFLTASPFNAAKAQEMGLCHEVVPLAQLEERAQYWIKTLLQRGPIALQEVNQLLSALTPPITPEMLEMTAAKIASLRVSSEGQEGLSAFIEKRAPKWL